MTKLKMHSPDLVAENLAWVAERFPGCITESRNEQGELVRAVDFDLLRQELSTEVVEGPQERYHLNWPGKREALLAANAPIAKTLRPCRDESVDFDTTRNLFIEGDNLDALKLLQETYLNKVKMIYIDPPYNTGNDFIYDDDFRESVEEFFERSNENDEFGNRLVTNTDANGRYHSDWLSLMYPRLKLAKTLLSDDGLLMISIDDHEFSNLRKLVDELFGKDAFLLTFVWQRRKMADSRNQDRASSDHEYVVCYKKPSAKLMGVPIDKDKYSNPDNDSRGPWFSADLTGIANQQERPNLHYDLLNPKTGISYPPSPTRGWSCAKETMATLIEEDRILWPTNSDGRPRRKKFLNEATRLETGFSSWLDHIGQTSEGTRVIQDIFGEKIFPFSKPLSLITELIEQATPDKEGIVLDFFAGSGTTAHSVIDVNARDGGARSFILVQIPEEIEHPEYKSIADICKARIRLAGEKIKKEAGLQALGLDIGFRVHKVDTSNMKDVYYRPDEATPDLLAGQIDNIKDDRTDEDLLFQVLLDWGVDLSLPIAKEEIGGKGVFFVDTNALAACFEDGIDEAFVKELAKREPLRAVFRDAGYGGDDVKINVEQIFKQLSPGTEVKTL